MRLKETFAAGIAFAALAFAGAGNAAVVPVEQSLDLHLPPGDLVYNIATDGQAATSTTSSYELVVQPSWTYPTSFTTFSTEPLGGSVSYALYQDTDATIGAGNTGTLVDSWTQVDIAANNAEPFHISLLGAGQYILQIMTTPGQMSVSTQIGAVPVPGAFSLLSAGLLGLVGLSRRRKLQAG